MGEEWEEALVKAKYGRRHDRHFHRKVTLKEAQVWRPTALENYFYSLEKSRSHPCGRINELEDLGKASWSSLELSLESGCDLNKHRSLGRTVTWEAHLEQKLRSGCPSGRHLSNRGLEMPKAKHSGYLILLEDSTEVKSVSIWWKRLMLFICSVVSDLWLHGLQHARLLCPSPRPGVYSNSCPLSWWCHSIILSSVIPFYSCLLFFPASGSFPMSWLFTSGGQSIRVSASASVLPVNIQDWFPLGWTGLIALQFKGLSRVFSSTTVQKHHFWCSALFMVQLSHPCMTTGKTTVLTMRTFVGKVMSLLFLICCLVLS